jgi:hypothetical protein
LRIGARHERLSVELNQGLSALVEAVAAEQQPDDGHALPEGVEIEAADVAPGGAGRNALRLKSEP